MWFLRCPARPASIWVMLFLSAKSTALSWVRMERRREDAQLLTVGQVSYFGVCASFRDPGRFQDPARGLKAAQSLVAAGTLLSADLRREKVG